MPEAPKLKSSASQAPNVTNKHWLAPIKPNIDSGTSQPFGAIRAPGTATGVSLVTTTSPLARMRRSSHTAHIATAIPPIALATRQDDAAVINPSADTPSSRLSAHDVSVMPTTRPRRAYGTRSLIHAAMLRSKHDLSKLSVVSPTHSTIKFGAAAIIMMPMNAPMRPTAIDVRRETRSTKLPSAGARKPANSETLMTSPTLVMETSKPCAWPAMMAMNGGANR